MRWFAALLLAGLAGLLGSCGDDDGLSDAERVEVFCERLDRLSRNDPFSAFGDQATSAEIAAAFEALVARAEELLDMAPPEARAAARQYTDAATELESLMRGAGFDGTRLDVRAYREQETSYGEAARRLERYLDTSC